jgi:hypothetical protein
VPSTLCKQFLALFRGMENSKFRLKAKRLTNKKYIKVPYPGVYVTDVPSNLDVVSDTYSGVTCNREERLCPQKTHRNVPYIN